MIEIYLFGWNIFIFKMTLKTSKVEARVEKEDYYGKWDKYYNKCWIQLVFDDWSLFLIIWLISEISSWMSTSMESSID